jgi:hypothetical protein
MVWDNSRPTTSEKIRNLSAAITPNWVAIEEASDGDAAGDKLKLWAVNLVDRATIGGPNTPAAITSAGQLYGLNDTVSGKVELFYINDTGGVTQLTQGTATAATAGQVLLPGGILMKWGTQAISGASPQAVTFPTAFPTAIFNIQVTAATDSSQAYRSTNATTAGFTLRWDVSVAAQNIYWVALGN